MDEQDWHGTISGYTNHRCRCERCRTANTQRQRDLRDRRKYGGSLVPHGTDNGYTNYGCRCRRCKNARALAKQTAKRAEAGK